MKNKRKIKQVKRASVCNLLAYRSSRAGITLIALVVTIVVLLILAGVSLNLVIGKNGIILKATEAAEKTKMAEARDQVSFILNEYGLEEYTDGTATLKDFLDNKVTTREIDAVTETDEGYEIEKDGYIISVDKDGNIIGEPYDAGTRPKVSNIKVVANSNGTGENLGAKSTDEGTTLYITFTHSIEGGATTVSPSLPFAVTSNGKYTFTITGTVNGETKSKNIIVTVNQFNSILNVGEYVNYTYDTAGNYMLTAATTGNTDDQTIQQTEGLRWRILNIKTDGSLDLISETPTNASVNLRKDLGYNNGVYLINDICAKQYSNSSLGITARNLTIEDIESNMNDKGIAAKNGYTYTSGDYTVKYGDIQTYTGSNSYYPNLYAQENGSGINTTIVNTDGIGRSDKYYIEPTTQTRNQANESGLTVTQNYYDFSTTQDINPDEYFDNSTLYSMIFGAEQSYWLASRYARCYSTYADFGLLYMVPRSYLCGRLLCKSKDGGMVAGLSFIYLRPVVSLGSDVVDTSLGKDASGAWQIRTK